MGRLLLDWSRSFSNFDANLARAALFGWSNATIDIPCSWSGIICQEGHFSIVFMDDNATLNGKLSCIWGSFAWGEHTAPGTESSSHRHL